MSIHFFRLSLLLLVPLAPRELPAAVEPFYDNLFRDGLHAYGRGDYAAAAKSLRLACFGMIADEQALAPCLVRLALAQGAAGDAESFQDTFRRLAEVEDRFGAYRKADLPGEIRAEFEKQAAALVPSSTLQSLPAFQRLAAQKAEVKVTSLPPKSRRRALEKRLAKEPQSPLWNLLLGELELSERRTGPALTAATKAVALAPQDPRALCLRGRVQAQAGRCPEALKDLASCPPPVRECGGLQAVAEVPSAPAPTPAPPPARSEIPAAPVQVTAVPPPAPSAPAAKPLTAAERQASDEARRLLDADKTDLTQLRQALKLARDVADAHPELPQAQHLAAEAAYRNSRWEEAAGFFQRGGDPGDDQPELLFYLAVSLYEKKDAAGAAAALRRALPKLARTPYIDGYAKKILG